MSLHPILSLALCSLQLYALKLCAGVGSKVLVNSVIHLLYMHLEDLFCCGHVIFVGKSIFHHARKFC